MKRASSRQSGGRPSKTAKKASTKNSSSGDFKRLRAKVGKRAPKALNATDVSFRTASLHVSKTNNSSSNDNSKNENEQEDGRRQGKQSSETVSGRGRSMASLLVSMGNHPAAAARASAVRGLRDLLRRMPPERTAAAGPSALVPALSERLVDESEVVRTEALSVLAEHVLIHLPRANHSTTSLNQSHSSSSSLWTSLLAARIGTALDSLDGGIRFGTAVEAARRLSPWISPNEASTSLLPAYGRLLRSTSSPEESARNGGGGGGGGGRNRRKKSSSSSPSSSFHTREDVLRSLVAVLRASSITSTSTADDNNDNGTSSSYSNDASIVPPSISFDPDAVFQRYGANAVIIVGHGLDTTNQVLNRKGLPVVHHTKTASQEEEGASVFHTAADLCRALRDVWVELAQSGQTQRPLISSRYDKNSPTHNNDDGEDETQGLLLPKPAQIERASWVVTSIRLVLGLATISDRRNRIEGDPLVNLVATFFLKPLTEAFPVRASDDNDDNNNNNKNKNESDENNDGAKGNCRSLNASILRLLCRLQSQNDNEEKDGQTSKQRNKIPKSKSTTVSTNTVESFVDRAVEYAKSLLGEEDDGVDDDDNDEASSSSLVLPKATSSTVDVLSCLLLREEGSLRLPTNMRTDLWKCMGRSSLFNHRHPSKFCSRREIEARRRATWLLVRRIHEGLSLYPPTKDVNENDGDNNGEDWNVAMDLIVTCLPDLLSPDYVGVSDQKNHGSDAVVVEGAVLHTLLFLIRQMPLLSSSSSLSARNKRFLCALQTNLHIVLDPVSMNRRTEPLQRLALSVVAAAITVEDRETRQETPLVNSNETTNTKWPWSRALLVWEQWLRLAPCTEDDDTQNPFALALDVFVSIRHQLPLTLSEYLRLLIRTLGLEVDGAGVIDASENIPVPSHHSATSFVRFNRRLALTVRALRDAGSWYQILPLLNDACLHAWLDSEHTARPFQRRKRRTALTIVAGCTWNNDDDATFLCRCRTNMESIVPGLIDRIVQSTFHILVVDRSLSSLNDDDDCNEKTSNEDGSGEGGEVTTAKEKKTLDPVLVLLRALPFLWNDILQRSITMLKHDSDDDSDDDDDERSRQQCRLLGSLLYLLRSPVSQPVLRKIPHLLCDDISTLIHNLRVHRLPTSRKLDAVADRRRLAELLTVELELFLCKRSTEDVVSTLESTAVVPGDVEMLS